MRYEIYHQNSIDENSFEFKHELKQLHKNLAVDAEDLFIYFPLRKIKCQKVYRKKAKTVRT